MNSKMHSDPPFRDDRLAEARALLVDDHQLAGPQLALEAGADQVERAGLGRQHPGVVEAADDQRADPVGVAEAGQATLREHDRRKRALDVRHRVGHGVGQVGGRVLRDQRRDHLGVGGRLEPDAPLAQVGTEGRRVGQVAVVAERDRSVGRVAHDRLRVLPHRRAGGGVARVADRDVAREAGEARLVEHLVHEAHVLHRHHARAVRDGDPGALLAAVLERIEAEVGEPRDVAVVIAGRVVDAEDAAHQTVSSVSPSARGMAPS